MRRSVFAVLIAVFAVAACDPMTEPRMPTPGEEDEEGPPDETGSLTRSTLNAPVLFVA